MRNSVPASSPLTAAADPIEAPWAELIPEDQWEVFVCGTMAVHGAGVPLLLGGALALATYMHHWRNTKDVDVIVRAAQREAAIAAVRAAGFDDYFDREPYDRSWIFRGIKNGVLFDVIWALPNHRVEIDAAWFERAPALRLRDRVYAVAPAEELARVKLYVMQRERCDWVDVLNIFAGAAGRLDWRWLVRRMGHDLPLLHAALAVFNWLCPARAQALPPWLRTQFALPAMEGGDLDVLERQHVQLFDSRPWFAMHQAAGHPLER